MIQPEKPLAAAKNTHGCAVVLGGRGVLILGPSGSGKTSLCFGLVETYQGKGLEALWVSDDQVYLENQKTCLIAEAPQSIAGKAELFGHGIIDVEWQPSTTIDLVVNLVDGTLPERMPVPKTMTLMDVSIPGIEVPSRHEALAIRLVAAKLDALFPKARQI